MIKIKNKRGLNKHFTDNYPEEACALILNDGTWIATQNAIKTSPLGQDQDEKHAFAISYEDYTKYGRDIACIAHSHIAQGAWENNAPSVQDKRAQEATAVPWMIYVLKDGKIKDTYIFDEKTCDKDTYRPGLVDEFTVIEDYFELPRVERANPTIWELTERLVLLGEFKIVAEIQPGCIVLGGADPTQAPTRIGVFTRDEQFIYRDPYGDVKVVESVPFQAMHKILVRS